MRKYGSFQTKNRCMKIRMLIEKIFNPICECDINLMGIPGGEILIGIYYSFIDHWRQIQSNLLFKK